MKSIVFLLCLFSMNVFAEDAILPNIWNNRSYVTIDAWNTTSSSVTCSGTITLELSDNTREQKYVNEYIFPHGSLYRTYYPSNMNATIEYVSHSVYCN